MRVAYVCADHGVPVFGHKGCSIHVREACAALESLGARVTLFASRRGGTPPSAFTCSNVVSLPSIDGVDVATRERQFIARNRTVEDLLARHGPFDVVYERAALWSIAGTRYAKTAGVPSLLEVNAPLVDEHAR